MITLYQFELSPFCDKVRRALQFKRVPYRIVEVPVATSALRIKKVNPIGKVPAIVTDEGETVADSSHIVAWLEARHASPPLYPTNARDRALCHVLEDWADESLYFYEMRLRFTEPHNAKRWIGELLKREPGPIRALAPSFIRKHFHDILKPQGIGRKPLEMVISELETHIGSVEALLAGREWLAGDALSVADLSVFVQLVCLDGTQEGQAALAKTPSVRAWMKRVDSATSGAPAAPERAA